MDLLSIYSSLLKYAGLEADREGFISAVIDDKREPILVNGSRLVLPTNEQLRSFNKEKIIFHPLAENIIKADSDVIQKFRDIINIRLNYTIGVVVQSLLLLIASPERHKTLDQDQLGLLIAVKDCDDKTVQNFIQQMVSGMKSKPDRLFVNIFLKKGGWIRENKYARLAVVSFPFYEGIEESKNRQKDKKAFEDIFKYLFQGLDTKDEYNYGSNSRVAPYLDALMNGSVGIASRLNDTLQLFSDHIDDSEKLLFESDWLDYFQNLEELVPEIRKIPAHINQEGNVAPVTTVNSQQPVQQLQYPSLNTPTNQQPVQSLAPVNNASLQQQQPQGVIHTERGLDFKSMMQNNPNLSNNINPLMPQLMNQYMQQMLQQQQLQQQMMPQNFVNPGMMQQPMNQNNLYSHQILPRDNSNVFYDPMTGQYRYLN